MKKELIKILEKIDKAKDNSKEILPILYEFLLLLKKHKKMTMLMVSAEGFEELAKRVLNKSEKYVFSQEWTNYWKRKEQELKGGIKNDRQKNKKISK